MELRNRPVPRTEETPTRVDVDTVGIKLQRNLGLISGTSIIVGTIIGRGQRGMGVVGEGERMKREGGGSKRDKASFNLDV